MNKTFKELGFKPGDKVKYVGDAFKEGELESNTGTVYSVSAGAVFDCVVVFLIGNVPCDFYELELAED